MAVRISPHHASIEQALAQAESKRGPEALAGFAAVRNQLAGDNSPYAFFLRGRLDYLEQKDDEALENYTAALKLDPNLSVAAFNCGVLLRYMDKPAAALERLQQAVNTSTMPQDRARYLLEIGYVKQSQEQAIAALEAFKKSAELNITYEALSAMGSCQLNLKDQQEKGIENLEKAVSLLEGKGVELNHISGLFNLATYYATRQKWQAAVRPLQLAMQVQGPPDVGVISRLIQAYAALNRVEERDSLIRDLRQAYASGQVNTPRFCREQIVTAKGLALVFEYLKFSSEFGAPIISMQWGERQKDDTLPMRTQLGSYEETTMISRELGSITGEQRVWHCDAYFRSGEHHTLSMTMGKDAPSYDSVREILLNALCGIGKT